MIWKVMVVVAVLAADAPFHFRSFDLSLVFCVSVLVSSLLVLVWCLFLRLFGGSGIRGKKVHAADATRRRRRNR